MWRHYERGERVGEWTTTEFPTREAAVSWARGRASVGVETTVSEVPPHHTMSFERVTVHPGGREETGRWTSCG